MLFKSPLYVNRIVLVGRRCRKLNEVNPCLAYLYVDAVKSFDVPAYTSLSIGMKLAEKLFNAANKEVSDGSDFENAFYPKGIVLKNQFGNALQEYRDWQRGGIKSWIVDFPDKSEYASIRGLAKRLQREAEDERDSDNFDAARDLDRKALEILRLVQMAASKDRVIS